MTLTDITYTWLVIHMAPGGDEYALFSDEIKAGEWAASQHNPCLITPYVVDEPLYGNARTN